MDQRVTADAVIGGTRYVFAERLERAEARIQAVQEVCVRDSFIADFDGLHPTAVEVEDILRALDGA